MATPDKAMETADGDSGEGHPPEHFDGADSATTENGKHSHREYNNVALEASERGPASAGPEAGEDGHGATNHSAGRTWEEEGEENPRRASSAQEPDGGETEERGSLKRSCAPNSSGRQGGEGVGGTPTQKRAPLA